VKRLRRARSRVLAVFAAALTLVTAVGVGLTAHLTRRQAEAEAFTLLTQDLLRLQDALEEMRARLQAAAREAAGDEKNLSDLGILYSRELTAARGPDPIRDRALTQQRVASINRLRLLLPPAGLSSVAVYVDGRLSHYVTTDGSGMLQRRPDGRNALVGMAGHPARPEPDLLREGAPPPFVATELGSADSADRTYDFPRPGLLVVRAVVPIQAVVRRSFGDTIAEDVAPARVGAPSGGGTLPARSVIGHFVFSVAVDDVFLRGLQGDTSVRRAVLSPDGRGALQALELKDMSQAGAAAAPGRIQFDSVTIGRDAYFQARKPWRTEDGPMLLLSAALPKAPTLARVQRTLAWVIGIAMLGLVAVVAVGSSAVARILYRWRLEELEHQERRQREVIDAVPVNIWSARPDGSIDFVNQRSRQETGLPNDRLLAWSWEAALHPEDREGFVSAWREALASGRAMERETRVRSADGTYRLWLIRNVPLRDERGDVTRWYGTGLDIEDRKRIEKERERLRRLQGELLHVNRMSMMGELAASLAHELKQPIAAAITSAGTCVRWLARSEPELDEARASALSAVRAGKRAAEIIDGLRSFYRKDRGAEPEAVDVNELIREMLVLLHGEAVRRSVSMHTELDPAAPPVLADRVQLQQVLMNLMLNGIEAMEGAGGELTVASGVDERGQLIVSVCDAGVGLPATGAERIFTPFFTTKPHGSGMGLTISHSVIEAHGGRLWADSGPERGARFHFTLPPAAREVNATNVPNPCAGLDGQ
jgi:PAS domain S-box-containing protein